MRFVNPDTGLNANKPYNKTMKNLPPKIRFIILTVALIGIIGLWYMAWKTAGKNQPETNIKKEAATVNNNSQPDFIKTGTITFNNPGLKENTPYFIFEEPGSPALSKELIIDKNSICTTDGEPLPCFHMSKTLNTAYEGRRVKVSGVSLADGSLMVKNLNLEK